MHPVPPAYSNNVHCKSTQLKVNKIRQYKLSIRHYLLAAKKRKIVDVINDIEHKRTLQARYATPARSKPTSHTHSHVPTSSSSGRVWGSLGRLRLRVGNLGRGGPAQGLSDGARGCAMKLPSVRYEPSKMYYSIHGTGTATRQQNKNERNCCKRCRGRMGQLAW